MFLPVLIAARRARSAAVEAAASVWPCVVAAGPACLPALPKPRTAGGAGSGPSPRTGRRGALWTRRSAGACASPSDRRRATSRTCGSCRSRAHRARVAIAPSQLRRSDPRAGSRSPADQTARAAVPSRVGGGMRGERGACVGADAKRAARTKSEASSAGAGPSMDWSTNSSSLQPSSAMSLFSATWSSAS